MMVFGSHDDTDWVSSFVFSDFLGCRSSVLCIYFLHGKCVPPVVGREVGHATAPSLERMVL